MSTLTYLTSLVQQAIQRLNNYEANAKKVDELPHQTALNTNSKIPVSRAGISEYITVDQIARAIQNSNYNQLLAVGTITVDGTDITVPSGVSGQINGLLYGTSNDTILSITLCPNGFSRKDIIVLTTANTVVVISGEETDGAIVLAPPTPPDTVYITEFDVNDTAIGAPIDPTLGSQFKKKSENSSLKITATGEDIIINLSLGGQMHYIVTSPALISVAGFSPHLLNMGGNPLYPGQDLIFENQTGNPVTLINAHGFTPIKFNEGANIIVPNGGKIWFRINGGFAEIMMKSWSEVDLSTKADLVGGKVPASQLPSYVDDVLEFANLASFPATGESGKIYIAIDTNLTYRWGGSSYVVMSSSLALGETSSTAYRGDRGKIAYDHSQVVGNPHGTTKTDIGLGNVPNIDATNPTNIVQTSSYRFVTDSEKTNLSTAYTHSQATGNPHNTKVEELTDVSGNATSIIDTDFILKKESGGIWRKITFANFKSWFTTELAKKVNIGLDTVFNFKNISAMTLTQFKALTPNIETIYFTEEQNATGWQQIKYNGLGISIPATTETKVSITNDIYIELDSDSTFNLIDVANTKINGIFERDFVIIKFNASVVTPAIANQWFKVVLKVNNVQTAVSPVFYLTEASGTVEQIAHNFALNVPAEMVTNGATIHLKTSTAMTFNNPTISVVRVHKSTNANM